MRGVVPPCTDEAAEGGCVGVRGGSQTSRGQAQLKTGKIEETKITRKGKQQRGTKSNEKKAAHKNNDLILENMHNMISLMEGVIQHTAMQHYLLACALRSYVCKRKETHGETL